MSFAQSAPPVHLGKFYEGHMIHGFAALDQRRFR